MINPRSTKMHLQTSSAQSRLLRLITVDSTRWVRSLRFASTQPSSTWSTQRVLPRSRIIKITQTALLDHTNRPNPLGWPGGLSPGRLQIPILIDRITLWIINRRECDLLCTKSIMLYLLLPLEVCALRDRWTRKRRTPCPLISPRWRRDHFLLGGIPRVTRSTTLA